MRPKTARELWVQLTRVFPGFAEDCSAEEIEQAERKKSATLHSVIQDFTPYFSGNKEKFSEKQLKALASLINEAVTVDDDLENAFGTCFLEHLHQVRSYKTLSPYLSAEAKAKAHA